MLITILQAKLNDMVMKRKLTPLTLSWFLLLPVTLSCFLLLAANVCDAQVRRIQGRVTETGADAPLAGVAVILKGTSVGTGTDSDGKYTLRAAEGDTLIFSLIGFEPKEITLGVQNVLDVRLKEDRQFIKEVVVVGYGTLDKKELTSAISHVSAEDFLTTGSMDAAMLIQGKVSGVSVVNTGAADPNSEASIQIRGISSRAAGLGPLVVIDGFPGGNMTNLNPDDIESMDILKDGAASAIYGARGSNGVVLITTKKGVRDGSVHTAYSGLVSANFLIKELDMLTADEYRRYRTEQGKSIDYGGNVDWLKEVSRIGFTHQHTLTLSGGDNRNSYRVSADYRNARGVDRRSQREEYGARASINHTTEEGLFTFSVNIAPRLIRSKGADWHTFHNAIEANPTSPIFDPDNPAMYFSFFGQQASYNPVEENNTVKDDRDASYLDWNATAKLNITDCLSTQLKFSNQQNQYDNSWFRPSTNTEGMAKGWSGEASKSSDKHAQYTLEWIGNFQKSFGGHNLKAMSGYSYHYFMSTGLRAENKNFPNDGITYNSLGQGAWAKEDGHVGMSSYKNDGKLISFFARVNYDWKKKYLLTASVRYEGSSKFGANHKWGWFPAVSGGWQISEEPFMKDVRWIDELKLRGDFGVTGNQDFPGYLSLNSMTGFGDYCYNGEYFTVWGPAKNVNPDLKWEEGVNWNIGLDFSVFDSRLSGSLNYFNRTQKDLLGDYNVPIPPYLFPTTFVNVGTMKNSGFEFDLRINAVRRRDFKYSIGLVGSTMDNRFMSFSNSKYVGQDFYDVAGTEDPFPFHYLQRIQKGERLGNYYMWKFAGFNRQGDWLIYDKDGEYKVGLDATDEDMRVVGNGLPKFTASMTHTFYVKDWDLSLYFRGAFGFDIFNIHDFYYGMPDAVGNVLRKAYTKNAHIRGNPLVCDYFLERGDYLKIDTVTLGYTLDSDCRYIHRLRLYLTGRNLFTITGFDGVDPSSCQVNGLHPGASGSRNYYPSTRQVLFGLQLNF